MDAAKIFEGIALLIELAQRGEIDPWDVQVIEVIDRYLREIFIADSVKQGTCEADLSQSGQAFLSASMLVLFKAKTLLQLESSVAEVEPSPEDFFLNETGAVTRRLPLEQQLRRRSAVPPQKRRVTLKELIEQLQLMAAQLQLSQAASSKTTRNPRSESQSRTSFARGTLELAHQENLTEVAGELEQFLNRHSHQSFFHQHDWLNLDQLVQLWTNTKQAESITSASGHSNKLPKINDQILPDQVLGEDCQNLRVSVFWALLLLSAQSKVELSQEEFYQEIKIRTLFSCDSSVHSEVNATAFSF